LKPTDKAAKTADETLTFIRVMDLSLKELLGETGAIFGHIIYKHDDGVSAVIIDPKTIRLFYHVHPKGP